MDVVETCGEGLLSSAEPSAQCSLPSIDEEVVGFEKEAESIMKKLIGGTKELDVISIFGMPGLGKTTLARKVYNNPSIVNHFDARVWCSVSQTYIERTLLIEILKQATGGNCEIKEDDDIADKLRKTLIGRRYLIVLDDIWEVEAWEDLGLCFPKGEDGSRVMVTTRIEQVAKHLQHRSDPYSLRFLTLEESWELLIKKVFQGESCPPNLLEASLQVAEHCKGLPLVIVLIAGIIVKMARQESLWFEVANDLSSHALGEQSMKVIQSSYEHLEDHLKPCLLYMGLFPEDYKIPVSALLNLWIAEEFVLNVDTENYMEEAARVCLNDLLSRSLVMVSKRRRNGDIKYCILHDVVREFCSAKLREEKFVQLIVPYNPYKHLYNKESRLCTYIHDDLVEQLDHCEYQVDKITIHESEESTKCFGQCSKSSLEFIAHPEFETWKNRSNPLHLLVELKLVRVLHLMDVETSSSWVPTVKLLTHLRYLALYVKDQFEFKWVSHLHDLHTLKVASRKTLFPRSSGLWKMNKLRHVNIRKFFLLLESEEEESSETLLENLKTFRNLRVHVNDRSPRLWWRFPNLEELGLSLGSLPCRSLFPISEVHTRLQSLDLECPCKTYRYPHSVGWESYFVFPSNLRNLRIRHFSITKELTSKIARLQKLENLKIIWGLLLGKKCWDVRETEFQALKYLTLEWMDLREWKASEESFPVLQKLLIKGCYSLEAIPPSFADIPTLQLIELNDCPDSVDDSAMNIKREIEETTGRDTLQLKRCLVELICSFFVASWTGVVKYHGPRPSIRPKQVFVANHTSMIDFIVLEQMTAFAVIMQKHPGWVGLLQSTILESVGCIWFNRSEAKDREIVARKLRQHVEGADNNPLLIFPEGTCVNNHYTVTFKKGAFELGCTVCPVAIKYNKIFVDAFWNSRKQSFTTHLLQFMTSWAVVCDVWYLEPQNIRPGVYP